MKRKLLLVIFSLIVAVLHSQVMFQKTLGDVGKYYLDMGYSSQQTTDGGVIVAGSTSSFGAGSFDFYLIKLASDGTLLWTKTYGGSNADEGYSVQQTIDGGFVIAGYTKSFGVDSSDIYLVKTASDGSLQWSKTYGGIGSDIGYSVRQTSDGGFIITGRTTSFGAGSFDVYLVKTDPAGSMQWANTYGTPKADYGYAVKQTNDGGFIIAGVTYFSGIRDDVYLVRTNSNGTLQWANAIGGTYTDEGYDVQQTPDGGFIVTGLTQTSVNNYYVYLAKTLSDGSFQWANAIMGPDTWYGGRSVQKTTDGGFIVGGSIGQGINYNYYDFYLVKTNANGIPQWNKAYGGIGNDVANSVQQVNDDGFIISGYTNSFGIGASNQDVYFIKTDSIGNAASCNQINIGTGIGYFSAGGVNSTVSTQSTGGVFGTPATVTGSGGIATTLCTTVAANEMTESNLIRISPNPFSEQTVIQSDNNFKNAELKVCNSFGQEVKHKDNLFGKEIILNTDDLPSGLYVIRLAEENKIYTGKLIIIDK